MRLWPKATLTQKKIPQDLGLGVGNEAEYVLLTQYRAEQKRARGTVLLIPDLT